MPKGLLLLMIKMGTTCSKKKVKTFFFSLYHTSKTVSEVSQTAKKYQNVEQMLSKSGPAEKEKIPNRCSTTIWERFLEVPSDIYKWKGYEQFGGYLFDIQLYVVKLPYLCFPYLSENVGKMRENVQKSFLSLWWENFRQFCYGM